MSGNPLSQSAARVQEALRAHGAELVVRELPASTRTAVEAAEAVGCAVECIAKSLIFQGKKSGEPLLVVAGGANRVDTKLVEALVGEPVAMAKPDFVREVTGYAIGGVPPVGHATPLKTLVDQDLLAHGRIWAAAGTPHALFELEPRLLLEITRGELARVC
ncbi:MAG: YbaK/EbsC family protein [Desulfovibrionaceae bacterium]